MVSERSLDMLWCSQVAVKGRLKNDAQTLDIGKLDVWVCPLRNKEEDVTWPVREVVPARSTGEKKYFRRQRD
jgi:hypothetical protein